MLSISLKNGNQLLFSDFYGTFGVFCSNNALKDAFHCLMSIFNNIDKNYNTLANLHNAVVTDVLGSSVVDATLLFGKHRLFKCKYC